MKKLIAIILILCLQAFPCFAENIGTLPENWFFIGYSYGGITFPVPGDTQFFELSKKDIESGIILIGFNQDFTLQLRCFTPDEITFDDFKEIMLGVPTAEVSYLDEDETILHVINTHPTASSELVGISMKGSDENMYKISIFTGINEDFNAEAKVWEISDTISAFTSYMDFSDWPLQEDDSAFE